MIGGSWGFIDTQGNQIVSTKFGSVDDFDKGLALVRVAVGEDEKYGYVDRAGKYVWYPTH